MRPTVRVVGLGSPHGDDQLGWRLVEGLSHARARGRRVSAVAVAAPLDLLGLLEGCRALVVIDACRSGRKPGSITRLTWPDERIESENHRSTHGIGLASTLALAETLGQLPPRVIVLAIEAGAFLPGAGLSPEVSLALAAVRRRLRKIVGLRRVGRGDNRIGSRLGGSSRRGRVLGTRTAGLGRGSGR